MDILKLNEISSVVDDIFGKEYKLTKDAKNPAAIMLRSFNMHEYNIPESVLCIGRAGAGTNNIPVADCAKKGIVVFNSPGANANAVKELVLCALLLSGRKILDGIKWTETLKDKGAEAPKLVESGKKAFIGGEIRKKTLGVIGLGAIGALVANAAVDLGMNVIGYDPFISINAAWNLNHNVKHETDLKVLFKECDFITLHVPLNDSTRGIVSKESLKGCRDGVVFVNCSRGELVNNADIVEAVKSGKVARYVTDFPSADLIGIENIITIPHLGASTPEAEDNCAEMVATQIVDFIENGNIANSVNFPACSLARSGKQRITVIHNNVKNVISAISDTIGKEGINIGGFVSKSDNKELAYAIIDTDEELSAEIIEKIRKLDNVVKVRVI